MNERRMNIVDPSIHSDPVIGAWLWAMQDARSRTMEIVDQLEDEMLDWKPDHAQQTISTILYHVGLIEADWLYDEVLTSEYDPDVLALFTKPVRDGTGTLSHITHTTLTHHLERLALVRERLLAAYQTMDLAEFRRVRHLPDYDVTPEWVLHHLLQHEAEHRSEIDNLRLQYLGNSKR